jgi:hypothetical protein
MTKFDKTKWEELSPEVKKAAEELGFTSDGWPTKPKECDKGWIDLEKEKQAAATTLGYDEETWNKKEVEEENNVPVS